jgi:hypothetical protein
MAEVTFLEALRQGLWEEMERDSRVFISARMSARTAARSK